MVPEDAMGLWYVWDLGMGATSTNDGEGMAAGSCRGTKGID